jgi:hypothetical protein
MQASLSVQMFPHGLGRTVLQVLYGSAATLTRACVPLRLAVRLAVKTQDPKHPYNDAARHLFMLVQYQRSAEVELH